MREKNIVFLIKRHIKRQSLLVLLLLQAIVGQAIASTAAPCKDMKIGHDMSMMQHTEQGMSHDMNVGMTMDMSDCCDQECNCPMNGAFTGSIAHIDQVNLSIMPPHKITIFIKSPQNSLLTSLYRPPTIS